jgi:hypothetical protein
VFLNKSIFNGGEVIYLTIKQGIVFHIFASSDELEVMRSKFFKVVPKDNSLDKKMLLHYNG